MQRFPTIAALFRSDVRPAFEPSVVNRNEAGRKAGEMNKHLAEADSLLSFGFREDAQTRFEAATIAAADVLLALSGGRLVNIYRGRSHELKKHFLVAALTVEGKPAPTIEQVLAITNIRHLVEYGASLVRAWLRPSRAHSHQVRESRRESETRVVRASRDRWRDVRQGRGAGRRQDPQARQGAVKGAPPQVGPHAADRGRGDPLGREATDRRHGRARRPADLARRPRGGRPARHRDRGASHRGGLQATRGPGRGRGLRDLACDLLRVARGRPLGP